mmetsp:Transcript_2228/g.7312  ORF Transcript_2228/g.7312 Transcript_2228/m.7312 type:complete len:379 (-) Transcript_2228:57-1193(-)
MAAAYALPKRTADRLEATSLAAAHIARKLTSPAALLWEATLPLVSFFDGKGFSNAVRYGLALAWTPPADRRDASTYSSESEDSDSDDDGSASDDERARRRRRRRRFAARDVEDCWLPFFCVNTNLTKQRCDVRLTGDLVFACRASMSVAELLPPARDPLSGDLHCDGCYVNNMPVHEMREALAARTVVGVSVVDSSGGEFTDMVDYSPEGVSGWYLLLCRWTNALKALGGYGADCRKVPSMSKVNATLQVLRNKSQLQEDVDSGTMDLFLEIAPVADFSASCYWQLTRVSKVALDYALPKVAAFVAKRQRLRSSSYCDGAPASLPALKSALFHSVDRDLSSSDSSSRFHQAASPGRDQDLLLARLSDTMLRHKSALHW